MHIRLSCISPDRGMRWLSLNYISNSKSQSHQNIRYHIAFSTCRSNSNIQWLSCGNFQITIFVLLHVTCLSRTRLYLQSELHLFCVSLNKFCGTSFECRWRIIIIWWFPHTKIFVWTALTEPTEEDLLVFFHHINWGRVNNIRHN